MTAFAPIVHALLIGADQLDATVDEMPQDACKEARIVLSGIARACQLTAEKLKAEEQERERKLMEPAK